MSVDILKNCFKDRVKQLAKDIDTPIVSISIRKMKYKWASYSTNGNLTFDFDLLEMRKEIQDYVIVHELLHYHVPNHGKLWKSLMSLHLGDYQCLEEELQRSGKRNNMLTGNM